MAKKYNEKLMGLTAVELKKIHNTLSVSNSEAEEAYTSPNVACTDPYGQALLDIRREAIKFEIKRAEIIKKAYTANNPYNDQFSFWPKQIITMSRNIDKYKDLI